MYAYRWKIIAQSPDKNDKALIGYVDCASDISQAEFEFK